MFALCYKVTIGTKKFSGVYEVEVKRSITSLGATCSIKVPTTAALKQTDGSRLNVLTAQQIKRGDAVEVELGYDEKYNKEFSGYVTRVNYSQPLEVECEDALFILRQKNIAKSYSNTTLDTVLKDLMEGTSIKTDTGGLKINISKLILATKTGGEVTREIALKDILSRYGLVGYFDTTQSLFVGLRQGKRGRTVKLRLGWNTIKDDELKYHSADESQVKIKAIYVDKLGVRTEVEVGDKAGASRTVFLTDVADKAQLKILAENELAKWKFNGYAGKITAFLQPFAEPGCIIHLTDPQYAQRSGDYYCEGIEVKFGTSGARRKIELGARV
jgi:hypothetical protein